MKGKFLKTILRLILTISVTYTIITMFYTIALEVNTRTYSIATEAGYNNFLDKYQIKNDMNQVNYEKLSNVSMQLLLLRSWDSINTMLISIVLGISAVATIKIFDIKNISNIFKGVLYYIANLAVLILFIVICKVINIMPVLGNVLLLTTDSRGLLMSYSILFALGMCAITIYRKVNYK